jgi:molecular chaperone DnaK
MSQTIDYGIDLGTTNSSIASCRGGEVRIFPNTDLMNVTPSVVYVSKTGRMLVGRKAYDTWIQDPQNTQAEFKRWMGFSDRLAFPGSGRTMSAEELSAEVLKALRADVSRQAQEEINAAVITVPAAFSSLQCDATTHAAKLAGFQQAPLLQEPIAAAIAYGTTPSAENQRWMVFDLGGGTLDIAIVSTRNGRLAVLEHQGNNRLGGKDIDRVIAETFLLAPLQKDYLIVNRQAEPTRFESLFRKLIRYAEQAKISLSTSPQTSVELFDIGEDENGTPIEATITLKRSAVEDAVQPLVDKCIDLAQRALQGARLAKTDLQRILLVGGPTQMPIIRMALASSIGAPLDFSLDPMTVVAQGAAFYASTLERTTTSTAPTAAPIPAAAAHNTVVEIELSHERASGTLQSPVAGFAPPGTQLNEVKIDADGAAWTSGWILLEEGSFQVDVMLNDRKPVTRFKLSGRDRTGGSVSVMPDTFSITRMLPMGAPPLPHTIAVELTDSHGDSTYDPLFKRHSPLPAETRRSYRADRTLRPSDYGATLPIKFWEIEVSHDPDERWWTGCVHIAADQIKRPIVEGAELELLIKIDRSRKLAVEVFVPSLNQSFVENVFIPDPPTAGGEMRQQLDLCFERLRRIQRDTYGADRQDLAERAKDIERELEAVFERLTKSTTGQANPDAALECEDTLRRVRVKLAHVDEQLEADGNSTPLSRKVWANARHVQRAVNQFGTEVDKAEITRLFAQLEKFTESRDARGLQWLDEQLGQLFWPLVHSQFWYWQGCFLYLKQPGRVFLNQQQARGRLDEGEKARQQGNLAVLRDIVVSLWQLQPPDEAQRSKDQGFNSGLRAGS